ncbi:hypothetical protein D3C86_1996060 [compost metagenome]
MQLWIDGNGRTRRINIAKHRQVIRYFPIPFDKNVIFAREQQAVYQYQFVLIRVGHEFL